MSVSHRSLRIVSLVPSLTETVCDLGLQQSVVGCTSFCTHPKSLRTTVPSVGGTKDADVDKILALNPTHVLTNTEENIASTIDALRRQTGLKVIETFPHTPRESVAMVASLADVFQCDVSQWQQECFDALAQLERASYPITPYLYFIWRNPWMVAGNQTYIAAMLSLIGYQNVVETGLEAKERYPVLDASDERAHKAQRLLFSSEPYAFKKRHAEEFLEQSGTTATYQMVDGQMLSWFGTRTLEALRYLKELS